MKTFKVKIINKDSKYFGHVFDAIEYINCPNAWRVWTGSTYMYFHKSECEVV